jgi:ferredoxin-fold anticodon binding domain-containing protein
MKYLEFFESKAIPNFKVGDIVYCIDNIGTEKSVLKIGGRYEIVKVNVVSDYDFSYLIKDDSNRILKRNFREFRFLYPEEFKEWQIEQDVKKYNI